MKRRRCIQGPDHEAGGDVAMTRREAKSRAVISSANCPITWRSRPKRCEASRIVKVTFGAAAALSVAPLTYSLRRDVAMAVQTGEFGSANRRLLSKCYQVGRTISVHDPILSTWGVVGSYPP
jgi:hypothetical protein